MVGIGLTLRKKGRRRGKDEKPAPAAWRALHGEEARRRDAQTPGVRASVRFSGQEKTDRQTGPADLVILMPRKEESSTVNPLV